jgi:lipopolysaccharide assembly protein A
LRFVYWTATALVALLLVIFAVSNREDVVVTFWPLPVMLAAPLYVVVLLALLAGFLVGELVAWINGRRSRREARRRGRRIEALERELAATQARLGGERPPATPAVRREG